MVADGGAATEPLGPLRGFGSILAQALLVGVELVQLICDRSVDSWRCKRTSRVHVA